MREAKNTEYKVATDWNYQLQQIFGKLQEWCIPFTADKYQVPIKDQFDPILKSEIF